jgi:hypothetical protein
MPCFSYIFRCISHHLEKKGTWSLLKNSPIEDTWYRYVINKMCTFSSCEWRDGRTYSCHILCKLKSSLQIPSCCFYDALLFRTVPYCSTFFRISFDFDLQLAVLPVHIEDCLKNLHGFRKPLCGPQTKPCPRSSTFFSSAHWSCSFLNIIYR